MHSKHSEVGVTLRGRVVIPIVLAALVQAGFAPGAHALFGRHHANQPHAQHRAKKNTSPYAYLGRKAQKQKKAKANYHQSTVTGDLFSGKKTKKK